MIDRRALCVDTKEGLLLRGWKTGADLQDGDIIYALAVGSMSSSNKEIRFSVY